MLTYDPARQGRRPIAGREGGGRLCSRLGSHCPRTATASDRSGRARQRASAAVDLAPAIPAWALAPALLCSAAHRSVPTASMRRPHMSTGRHQPFSFLTDVHSRETSPTLRLHASIRTRIWGHESPLVHIGVLSIRSAASFATSSFLSSGRSQSLRTGRSGSLGNSLAVGLTYRGCPITGRASARPGPVRGQPRGITPPLPPRSRAAGSVHRRARAGA